MPSPADPRGAAPDLGDLMHVAFRRLRHRWSEQLAPFELTPYQFRALQAVGGGRRGQEAVLQGRESADRARGAADRTRGAGTAGQDGAGLPGGGAGQPHDGQGLPHDGTGHAHDGTGHAHDGAGHPHDGAGHAPDVDCAECRAEEPDAEGLRLKDLAERLRIAPRSATEVVDQLQAKGLVERRPDPVDRRATRIVLTAEGAGVRSRVREERRRQAGDYFSVLSAPDQAELRRLLSELVRAQP